jgi:hypothetical protein
MQSNGDRQSPCDCGFSKTRICAVDDSKFPSPACAAGAASARRRPNPLPKGEGKAFGRSGQLTENGETLSPMPLNPDFSWTVC